MSRRDFMKTGAAAVGLAASLRNTAKAQAQDQSTSVFRGGTVPTVDSEFSEAEALAVRGNQIIAVGTDVEVRAAAGDDAT